MRLPLLAFGLVLSVALVGFALAQKTPRSSASQETHSQNPQTDATDTKVLLIAVQTYGFEPTELDVEEGRYLLVIQNRSGLNDLVVTLEGENGKKIFQENAQQRRWRKRFDLKQGSYRLTAENNPEWSCVIRVK